MSTGARIMMIALVLLPGSVLAASLSCEQPVGSSAPAAARQKDDLDQLDEVVVSGDKPTDSTSALRAWLKQLVGQYTYEGYVDLCGKGNAADQRPVTGMADCIGFSAAPSVQCQINVRWPEVRGSNGTPVLGGISNLSPAMVVYGLEAHHWGVRFTQVDNNGVAEPAMGWLAGHTLTSKERCIGIAGNCQKITRITAEPNSSDVAMMIDVELNYKRALRYTFLLHRVSNIQKGEQHGAAP